MGTTRCIRKGLKTWRLVLLAGLVGLFFAGLQFIFIVTPNAGSGLPFVLDWLFYKSYYGEFIFNWWKVIIQGIPGWPQILSLLDAFFTGVVLFLGLAIGLQLAANQLGGKELATSPRIEEDAK